MKSTTFECPWCGNELKKSNKETVRCIYCGEVIKPANGRRQAEALYPDASLKIGKEIFGRVASK